MSAILFYQAFLCNVQIYPKQRHEEWIWWQKCRVRFMCDSRAIRVICPLVLVAHIIIPQIPRQKLGQSPRKNNSLSFAHIA